MLKIKLARFGKKHQAHYRIVVNEARDKRDGKYVALLGHYSPVVPKKLEIDVFIPKKQLCYGAPAYFKGDTNTVEYLIRKNLDYFETFMDDYDAMIIPEATCSAMIKHDWEVFCKNNNHSELIPRIQKIGRAHV